MTKRNVLRAMLTILGAGTAAVAIYLDHPSGELPVWFVLSAVMGGLALICTLVSMREALLLGISAFAASLSALAMVLAIMIQPQYTDPAPKVGGLVYMLGILIMGALPWLFTRRPLATSAREVRPA
jgi:hypothetical protein